MIGNLHSFDSLLDELRRLDADWEGFFGGSPWTSGIRASHGAFPPLNVGSSNDGLDVYMFAAGLDPEKLDVSLQQNRLTVSGERAPTQDEAATWYRRERFSGSFQRTLTLPDDVDPEHVEASYNDGVLHVRVGRREEVKPRRIEVH